MQLLVRDLSISKKITNEWIIDNCYIAGGACVSNATRQPIHDVDIYFKTEAARNLFIDEVGEGRYIAKSSNEWKEMIIYDTLLKCRAIEVGDIREFGTNYTISSRIESDDIIVYKIDDGYEEREVPEPLFLKQKWMFENGYDYVLLERNHFDVEESCFLGNKSITLKKDDIVYQFILRFFGESKQMMDETFDFQHCKIAYDLASKEYIASQETWEALAEKTLHYVNSFYPVSSLKRLYKYGGRGYKWNNDEFVKIIRDIHTVDTDNKFVMEDQLIGYYEDFDYDSVFGYDQEQNYGK